MHVTGELQYCCYLHSKITNDGKQYEETICSSCKLSMNKTAVLLGILYKQTFWRHLKIQCHECKLSSLRETNAFSYNFEN
jgi:hypothetical protein